jgi:hypothetical protein
MGGLDAPNRRAPPGARPAAPAASPASAAGLQRDPGLQAPQSDLADHRVGQAPERSVRLPPPTAPHRVGRRHGGPRHPISVAPRRRALRTVSAASCAAGASQASARDRLRSVSGRAAGAGASWAEAATWRRRGRRQEHPLAVTRRGAAARPGAATSPLGPPRPSGALPVPVPWRSLSSRGRAPYMPWRPAAARRRTAQREAFP